MATCLSGVAATAAAPPPAVAAASSLEPLASYQARLATAAEELNALGARLEALPDDDAPRRQAYAALLRLLHAGELGRFWATARGADRYVDVGLPGERGALARDEADLFALLPERAGPLSKLLRPRWDDADDPLCLLYSCVNDPGAPASINALYALKLLHVGLGLGKDGDRRVTPEGLAANVADASAKLAEYGMVLARAADGVPGSRLGPDGTLEGVQGPPTTAERFGPSPLG